QPLLQKRSQRGNVLISNHLEDDMVTSNVRSGVGCVRDGELANGEKRRLNSKNYNDGIDRERLMHPPMLNHEFGHRDYVEGDLVSRKEKHIVPLDPGLEFAGIIERVG